ncbi:MAG: methylated-DNA--[protein]-cysteine S-methyltransferase [Anaerolineales bacterium]|nr:methylated-DNA--[protein]-cysteine S-methyltransferase [Anaerolineales bacterium]
MGTSYVESPIGLVEIKGTDEAITSLYFVEAREPGAVSTAYTELAAAQVAEYFAGERRVFDLELAPAGTPFQQAHWQQLLLVAFGEVQTYQEIANRLGKPAATRAVGAANGQNPISIIIPCHRIIGSNGKLTGYGGGLWRKEWLLRHEGG